MVKEQRRQTESQVLRPPKTKSSTERRRVTSQQDLSAKEEKKRKVRSKKKKTLPRHGSLTCGKKHTHTHTHTHTRNEFTVFPCVWLQVSLFHYKLNRKLARVQVWSATVSQFQIRILDPRRCYISACVCVFFFLMAVLCSRIFYV